MSPERHESIVRALQLYGWAITSEQIAGIDRACIHAEMAPDEFIGVADTLANMLPGLEENANG